MRRVLLNNTDLRVSPICMGTANYGTDIDRETAKTQINMFVEMGGNFIDTAHVYGDWVPGVKGRSERIIGDWFKETGRRHDIILSTKGAHPDLSDMSKSRVNPAEIKKDLDESLLYLKTDYIDIYFLHRDIPQVPVAEILDTLEDARLKGKIRYYGCSNWSLPRIEEADRYAREHQISGFVCNQLMWSLADINSYNVADKTLVLMDRETYEYHKRTGKNAMAYTSIAKGYFSKKADGIPVPKKLSAVYDNESNENIYRELVNISRELNRSISEVALAYMMHQEFTTVPIVSFSNQQQLKEGIRSCDLVLDNDIVERLRRLKRYVY